jgi:hypothetical protein
VAADNAEEEEEEEEREGGESLGFEWRSVWMLTPRSVAAMEYGLRSSNRLHWLVPTTVRNATVPKCPGDTLDVLIVIRILCCAGMNRAKRCNTSSRMTLLSTRIQFHVPLIIWTVEKLVQLMWSD